MPRCPAPAPLVVAALLFAPLGLLACGSEEDATSPAASRAAEQALPFPPRAMEPPTTVPGSAKPAGTVLRIGGRPEGIAVDPQTGLIGVATDGPNHTFALIDARTLAVRRTIQLPSDARHVQADAGRFLVPLESADQLAIVTAKTGAVQLIKVGDEPHDAAAVGRDLVVGDEFGGTATIVRGGRVRATVPIDVQPGGVAAADDHLAAVVSVRAYTVALLDLRTLELGPSQNAGEGPSHVVAAPDGRLFVADTRGDGVLEYATRPRLKALQRLTGVGSPYGLAIDGPRNRLWVTDVRGGRLLMVDIAAAGKPKIVRTFPTVLQPNSVAVDSATGAAIVAGQLRGQLQRVMP